MWHILWFLAYCVVILGYVLAYLGAMALALIVGFVIFVLQESPGGGTREGWVDLLKAAGIAIIVIIIGFLLVGVPVPKL